MKNQMKLLHITEKDLIHLIHSLSVDKFIIEVLHEAISLEYRNYIEFIHNVMRTYSYTYINLTYEDCTYIADNNAIDILEEFKRFNRHIKAKDLFIADKFDMMYNGYSMHSQRISKFNEYFYEDMYRLVENVLKDTSLTNTHIDSIFESIEQIVTQIESQILAIAETKKLHNIDNIFFSVESFRHNLQIAVL